MTGDRPPSSTPGATCTPLKFYSPAGGVWNAALSSTAVGSMLRLRPARRSAAAIRLTDSFVAAAGVGAMRFLATR